MIIIILRTETETFSMLYELSLYTKLKINRQIIERNKCAVKILNCHNALFQLLLIMVGINAFHNPQSNSSTWLLPYSVPN